MPKAKNHSHRRRNKRKHYNKTKRGGVGTDELDAMESRQKYGDVVMPHMMNPMNIPVPTTNEPVYQEPPVASPEEVAQVFEDRSAKLAEIDELTEKYAKVREEEKRKEEEAKKKTQQEIQRLKDVKKIAELNRNPLTREEIAKVFDNPPADCTGPNCTIMGGRKTRRYRRKGRKSRKSRKH